MNKAQFLPSGSSLSSAGRPTYPHEIMSGNTGSEMVHTAGQRRTGGFWDLDMQAGVEGRSEVYPRGLELKAHFERWVGGVWEKPGQAGLSQHRQWQKSEMNHS